MWSTRNEFRECVTEESAEILQNPGRGWYQIHSFDICGEISFEELKWCIAKQDSLALVILDIGGCKNRRLLDEELARIRELLAFFCRYEKDVVLRIVYDREGKGLLREPSELSRIREHMEQIGPVLKEYRDFILVCQGLWIGNWGEMHGSAFTSERSLKKLAETFRKATEGSCLFAVRRPVQWRMLYEQGEKRAKDAALFDDAIFASATHLGTFLEEPAGEGRQGSIKEDEGRENSRVRSRNAARRDKERAFEAEGRQWNAPWSPAEELRFEETCFVRMPNGGEALQGEELSAEEAVRRLRQMHICYLNRIYDENRLREWKEELWTKKDVFHGASIYDYIGLHMGYRFVVRDVKIQKEGFFGKLKGRRTEQTAEKHGENTANRTAEGAGRVFFVSVKIENIGFGNLTQEAECCFALRSDEGGEVRFPVETDAREWDCGTVTAVSGEIFVPPEMFLADIGGKAEETSSGRVLADTAEKEEEVSHGKEADGKARGVSLYLLLERRSDKRKIYFANRDSQDGVKLAVCPFGR